MMLRHYNGGDLKAHCDTAVQVVKILCERSSENIVTIRRLIESLLVILKTCGDYEIQNNVVCSLLQLPQVQQFQDWFASAWFSSDDTVATFQKLSEPRRDADKSTNNIRTFLNCFNKNESDDSLVVQSIRCESAAWDSHALLPPDQQEGDLWLDLNPGTKCLTICVKGVPSWFERHVTIPKNTSSVCLELPEEFLLDAIVAQCPFSVTEHGSELTIRTKRGTLEVGVSDQRVNWSYVNGAWKYITKRDLVFLSLSNPTCVDQHNALGTSLSHDVTPDLSEFFKNFSVEDCEL